MATSSMLIFLFAIKFDFTKKKGRERSTTNTIIGDEYRCGFTGTTTGIPCRNPVSRKNTRCNRHKNMRRR